MKRLHPKTAVIAGYDAVSPLGTDLCDQWEKALKGESGIGPLTRFPLNEKSPVRVAGEVPAFDASPYPFLRPREMAHWTSPIFPHALLVVHRALKKSGIEITRDLAPRVAVTFSSAVGGIDAVLAADRRMIAENQLPHPFTNPNSCINMVGGKISMLTGATGPITAVITACATGVTSMLMGALFLERGLADLVICGAVDFCLTAPIVAGFATMNGAYRPKPGEPEDPPEQVSRPFSVHRRGFVVSEGAGCILLASKEFADTHGIRYSAVIAGGGMTSDARHFVSPNRETVQRCIKESIEDAGITKDAISSINAHAASTRVGDKVEYEALKGVFGDMLPPITANKSLIGHAMGASSAIESIFALMGMERQRLLPTVNFRPDPEIPMEGIVGTSSILPQEYVLKNSFGFGGCNSCIVFRKTDLSGT